MFNHKDFNKCIVTRTCYSSPSENVLRSEYDGGASRVVGEFILLSEVSIPRLGRTDESIEYARSIARLFVST